MDISKLGRMKPYGFVNTSLGEVAVFGLTTREYTDVAGKTSVTIKGVAPDEFVKRMLPFIIHPKQSLDEDLSKPKPKQPTFSDEQIAMLTSEEIDSILDIYIEKNEELTRKAIATKTKGEDGNPKLELSYGEIEHPRNDGEKNSEYLHRLYVLYEQKLKKMMAEMSKKVLGPAHFSEQLTGNIFKTLQMGDTISKALEAIRPPEMPDFSNLIPKPKFPSMQDSISKAAGLQPPGPKFDYAKIAKLEHETKWAPFNAVNDRLDAIVELTSESIEFMVQMNETQTRIAAEIKASGEESSKIGKDSLQVTKYGFWLTIFVVIISIAALWVSTASFRSSGEGADRAHEYSEEIIGGLSEVKAAIEAQTELQATHLKTIEEMRQRIEQLESQVGEMKAKQTTSPDATTPDNQ